MKTKTLFKLAAQSIQKNKMRATLTMLGIIIGVAAVIVMVAVGYGARTRIRAQIDNLGTNMIVITPGGQSTGGVSQGAQAFANLKIEDVDKIRRESQFVSAISPIVVSRTQVLGPQGNWRTLINGVDPDYQTIRNWDTQSGTFFGADDVRAGRTVAVLGQTVAMQLFPGRDPVGQSVQIGKVPFKVLGVLAPKGQTASGSDSDDVILIPYTTAQTRLSGRQFIPQILASTTNEQDIPAAQSEIQSILEESHKITDGNDDFTVRNQTDLAQAAESSTQFLVEALVMGVAGGLAGLLFGVLGAKLVGHFTGWETVVSPLIMLVSIGFSGAVGVFFGYYPARKAAALNPIQALRYE